MSFCPPNPNEFDRQRSTFAFRAAFGTTPHQYVRERRVERAKELLVTTGLPVTEICDQIGFQSLGSFSSLFRRLTGETPAEYRAKRRKNVYIPGCFVRMYRAEPRKPRPRGRTLANDGE